MATNLLCKNPFLVQPKVLDRRRSILSQIQDWRVEFFFVEAKSAVRDLEFLSKKMDPIRSLTFLVLLLL